MTFPIGRGPLPLRAGHVHPVAGTCLAVVGAGECLIMWLMSHTTASQDNSMQAHAGVSLERSYRPWQGHTGNIIVYWGMY